MGKKGVKYFRRGEGGRVKVGFFYYEIILNHLAKHKEGRRLSQISSATKIPYNTVRSIILDLHEMQRIEPIKRKVHLKRKLTYWKLTPWKLSY